MADRLASRLEGFEAPTVWHEFTPLAAQYDAVNLGQGFPDWACEDFVKEASKLAIDQDHNQYARPSGHPRLAQTLVKKYSRELNRDIQWATEVAVGVGATETIFAALQAFINPGDEVIILEPAFDIYRAQVQMASGVPKFVPMHIREDKSGAKAFYLDESNLAAAFSDRTRAVVLNNPHNPTGKVFTKDELAMLAKYVLQHPNVIVISDEVYEHITFDGRKHHRIANESGMWDRTLTVSSSGKTFSVTGWKVGWAIGPAALVKGVQLANNWVQFSVATPFQEAVASMLEKAEESYRGYSSFYEFIAETYREKRDRLASALQSVGIKPIMPAGGIFLYCDVDGIQVPEQYTNASPRISKDWAFCRWLTIEKGIVSIPTSAFFSQENKEEGYNWARFAYCKTDTAIDEAIVRLSKLKK